MKFISLTQKTIIIIVGLYSSQLVAAEEYLISIKNHEFEPDEIIIPANKKVKLKVKNLDATPEEFESYELNREKIITGNSSAIIFIGPLSPGTYPFFGEFNPKTAHGRIIIK